MKLSKLLFLIFSLMVGFTNTMEKISEKKTPNLPADVKLEIILKLLEKEHYANAFYYIRNISRINKDWYNLIHDPLTVKKISKAMEKVYFYPYMLADNRDEQLIKAVRENKINKVTFLLNQNKFLPKNKQLNIDEYHDSDGLTLLHQQVKNHNFTIAKKLLEAGANVNSVNQLGRSVAYTAFIFCADDIIQEILKYNPDFTIKNSHGFTLFHAFLRHSSINKSKQEIIINFIKKNSIPVPDDLKELFDKACAELN